MTHQMKWNKDCRLGLDDIDTQHRLLFAIANELDDIHSPDEQGPEIKYIVNHIRKYIKEHFASEEVFLTKHNYPELEKHKTAHTNIIDEVNHTLTSSNSLSNMVDQLKYMMTVWIKDHILDMDMRYAIWYKQEILSKNKE